MKKASYKILIVEDDEVNISFLKEVLEDATHQTVIAKDGLEALEQLEQHPDIDIILLDRMMPNMDVMAVMEKINKNPRWAAKPVIMQTAAGTTTDIIEGSSTGIYYYLTKPFDDVMVMSVINSAIEDLNRTL